MTIASNQFASRVVAGRMTQSVSVTPTVEATPDYADGDVIGGKMTIAAAARSAGGSGAVVWGQVYSLVDIGASIPIRVVLFNSDPSNSTFTENAALSVHADDLSKIVGVLNLDQRLDLGTPVILHTAQPVNIPFVLASGTSLYGVAVAGGAINLASAADLTFVFGIEQN